MARRCVFCGTEGSLTKEHVVPRWFTNAIERSPQGRFIHERENDVRVLSTREATSIDIQVKAVCRACNSGWMSQLEATAQPLLLPLMAGYGTTLDRNVMNKITLWSIKTAMMDVLASPEPTNASISPQLMR